MSERLHGVDVSVPFIYGSSASAIQKKATPDAHSHRWTVYLRGVGGEDLTHVISKVTFALHPSFAPPTRTLSEPPYEVTETGWGEFEIGITVEFVAAAESPPVELVHALKLYHGETLPPPAAEAPPGAEPTAPVVRERYDEFVFVSPPASFHAMLTSRPAREPVADAEELFRIATARSAVAQQIASMRAALSLEK